MTFKHPGLKPNATAVITGGSLGGIGFSIAKILLTRYSMRVLLADLSSEALAQSCEQLVKDGVSEDKVFTHVTDVSDSKQVFELADVAWKKLGKVDWLFLNAGRSGESKDFAPGGDLDNWKTVLDVNFGGVLNGSQAFVQKMVDQDEPGGVVITGSKQGITQPPGRTAYNVSKSAVKSLAEGLAHSLIPTRISAHLLVPGWTYTKLTVGGGGVPDPSKKPAGAWTPEQVAEELFARLDEFYIICPDNSVSWELDAARIRWNTDDILQKRPALSRWHPEFKDAFEKFVQDSLASAK